MKLIKAYVRTIMVDKVIHALEKVGAPRMTAIDVRAIGDEVYDADCCVSVEYGTTYSEMVKLEIISPDKDVKKFVKIIEKTAKTGKMGDGIISVSPVEEVIRIRTGERENLTH